MWPPRVDPWSLAVNSAGLRASIRHASGFPRLARTSAAVATRSRRGRGSKRLGVIVGAADSSGRPSRRHFAQTAVQDPDPLVAVVLEDEEEPGCPHAAAVVVGHDGRVAVDAEPPEQGRRRLGPDREALGVGGRVVELVGIEVRRPREVADAVGGPAHHAAPHVDEAHAGGAEGARRLVGLDEELGIRVASGAGARGRSANGSEGDEEHGDAESSVARHPGSRHSSLQGVRWRASETSVISSTALRPARRETDWRHHPPAT